MIQKPDLQTNPQTPPSVKKAKKSMILQPQILFSTS